MGIPRTDSSVSNTVRYLFLGMCFQGKGGTVAPLPYMVMGGGGLLLSVVGTPQAIWTFFNRTF